MPENSHPKEKKDKNWLEFEQKTVDLFNLKGYKSIHDVMLAGRQNDIILNSNNEILDTVLVECKYFDSQNSKVGVETVEGFSARVIRLRANGDICGGYLYATPISQQKQKDVC